MTNRVGRNPEQIALDFLHYPPKYRKHRSLWDTSVAAAFGPLLPNEQTTNNVPGLADRSLNTAGAVWSVGAGDVPKYTQDSLRGQAFTAGRYDGINDVNPLGKSINFVGRTHAFSVFAWIKTTTTGGKNVVARASSENSQFQLSLGFDGVYANVGGTVSYSTDINTVDGNWHHIGFTAPASATGLLFYGDGSRLAFAGGTGAIGTVTIDRDVVIGARTHTDNATYAVLFNGLIAGVRMHSRVLTPNEIATLALGPLEAYRVEVPRYYDFPSTPTTAPWLWAARRNSMIGSGLGV
jgi:hypothetical protein